MDLGPRAAIITGASSGLGAAFARALARRGCALWLLARRRSRLEALAAELRAEHGASVELSAVDLSESAAVSELAERVRSAPHLSLLVNNAGFGVPGLLWETDIGQQCAMLRLHAETTLRLCHAAIPRLSQTPEAGIINVASIGGLLPKPGDATYCASKAFVVSLSVALADELRGSGVRVQALCPGFTRTEFHGTPAYSGLSLRAPRAAWMTAERVVQLSLGALPRGPVVLVPGRLNRLAMQVARAAPRRHVLRVFDRLVVLEARP